MKLRGTLAALSAASLLVLAGCGSADDVAGADDSPAAKTAAASNDGSALTQANFAQRLTAAQRDARTAHMEMDVAAAGQSISASGDMKIGESGNDSAMSMTMNMAGMGDIEMRLVDEVLYMNMGAATGGKFAKLDLNDASNPLIGSLGGIADQMDPAKSVEQLEGAVVSVDESGDPVEIDGVQTQPYEVVVDTSKLSEAAPSLGDSSASLPPELSYTYWLGEDDLIRKMSAQVSGATVEITYTKWGEDVDVKVPSKGQISDINPFDQMPSSIPST